MNSSLFKGSPSNHKAIITFIKILEEEYGIPATVRIRRGIDIDAGCGQLSAKVSTKEERKATVAATTTST